MVPHSVKYQIITDEGEIKASGVLPITSNSNNVLPNASFGPHTLDNGDTMLFLPEASPTKGFWMVSGTSMRLRINLNRSATIYANIQQNVSVIKSFSGKTSAVSLGTTAPTTGYYSGRIRNSSSDPITVTSASFDF